MMRYILKKIIVFLMIIPIYAVLPNCEHGDPYWENALTPQDYEFSATITLAVVMIDSVEMETGKLAAFYGNEVRAVDSDGATYFPPLGIWTFELSIWSNQLQGEEMTFKYYSDAEDDIIDLNETYIFISDDVVFDPFYMTGSSCESLHFDDVPDDTGISEMIIFGDTISSLDIGDEIGIFDLNGLLSDGDCSDEYGEILVGTGLWDGQQLNLVAISSLDYCDMGGFQLPGFVDGNEIIVRVWDTSDTIEYETLLTITQGSPNFEETSFVFISEIELVSDGLIIQGCIDEEACNFDLEANEDDGSCEYADYECWDGSLVCHPSECPESMDIPPTLFEFNESTSQAFYYFIDVAINSITVEEDDWVAAFKGDVCVGSKKWDTDLCNNGVCDVPAMGDDGQDGTDGYMLNGEYPTFKIYDVSQDTYYDADPSENFPWESNGLFTIDGLYDDGLYCGENPSCSGCMDTDACNFDEDAIIDNDSCEYQEFELLEPQDNEIIVIDDLDGSISFDWSDMHQSCSDGNIEYHLSILDQGLDTLVSIFTDQSQLDVSYLDLEIVIGEINSYIWNAEIEGIYSAGPYQVIIDARSLESYSFIDNYHLSQNYPNPFNPSTTIDFSISNASYVEIKVYDVSGNFMEMIISDYYTEGFYQLTWDGSSFPSGIYILQMEIDNAVLRRKMVLIK